MAVANQLICLAEGNTEMQTLKKTTATYPLGYTDYADMRDEMLGAIGTVERSQHEGELSAELAAERLKQLRKHATSPNLREEKG